MAFANRRGGALARCWARAREIVAHVAAGSHGRACPQPARVVYGFNSTLSDGSRIQMYRSIIPKWTSGRAAQRASLMHRLARLRK